MSDSFEDFAKDLNAEAAPIEVKQPSKFDTKQFTCESCHGTGQWAGGTNRHNNAKCNTCHGRGFLVSSYASRQAAKIKRHAKKQAGLDAVAADWASENEALHAFLTDAASWSTFAASLLEATGKYGSLTDKQRASATSMMSKMAAKAEAKAAQDQTPKVEVDLAPIRKMFETAVNNGHKRPKYRAGGLVISKAPDHGANAGALYVKTVDDEYQGKLVGTNFIAMRNAAPETVPTLAEIAADPASAAVRYGRKTGTCSCCGRELTDESSIAAGIGPVCATKWGF